MINVGQLVRVSLDALAATIIVTVVFSVAVLASVRAVEARERNTALVLGYGTLAAACLLGSLAAVAYGVILLANK